MPVAVVTGASSGIGASAARKLAAVGFDVVVGARRADRLNELANEIGARAMYLDVTDLACINDFASTVATCDLLVNNAGGAIGLGSIVEAQDDDWSRMYELNVLSVMRLTRALLAKLIASGNGQIINVGSIAAYSTYPGGAGYTAAKHGLRAVNDTLRKELLGQPVRVSEIDPGMVDTEFSTVRLGDKVAADRVYEGMTPLVADDIAEAISWVATRPSHVNIDRLTIAPRDQVVGQGVHRIAP